MKDSLTEIAFILDQSGSMQCCAEAAISGFNELLQEQQAVCGDANFSLVLFNTRTTLVHDRVPIRTVSPLDDFSFHPGGCTALLDAVGLGILGLGRKLARTPEAERPGQVIFAILTDGLENSSTRFGVPQVAEMVRHQKAKYNWHFLFLGANQDAWATGRELNIDQDNAATWAGDWVGAEASQAAVSRKMRAMRTAWSCPTNTQAVQESQKSLADILQEEDDRVRQGPRRRKNR